MADIKEYGYYRRGNKFAIMEVDTTTLPNTTFQGDTLWKSPQESITDGIEIEYSYSGKYRVYSNAAIDVNKFYVNGWTVIGGYLAFVRARLSSITNWGSSPESAVTSGSAGATGGDTSDYIIVRGSSRWNGLHKVQTAGSEGQLVTYTKVSETVPYWEDQNVDFNTDEEVFGRSGGSLYLADYFASGDYIFISGSNDESNNGLFSISSVATSSTVNSSKLTLGTKYNVVNSSDSTSYSTGLNNEYSADAALVAETSQSDINIYKAYRDFCYVLTDVDVLNDEADSLPVSDHFAKAIVYYVKAKLAEDAGQFELKEYNMKEFYRIAHKSKTSREYGPTIIMPGTHAIR